MSTTGVGTEATILVEGPGGFQSNVTIAASPPGIVSFRSPQAITGVSPGTVTLRASNPNGTGSTTLTVR